MFLNHIRSPLLHPINVPVTVWVMFLTRISEQRKKLSSQEWTKCLAGQVESGNFKVTCDPLQSYESFWFSYLDHLFPLLCQWCYFALWLYEGVLFWEKVFTGLNK